MFKRLLIAAAVLLPVMSAQATVIQMDLQGKAGFGLLPGNENGTLNGTPGSGGEIGAGISYDDVTNLLTINVGWGSGNGFTNLTGNTVDGHIHGPTANPAPASFTDPNVGVFIGLHSLPGWNTSATNGGFTGTISWPQASEVGLLEGRFYFNVHTAANGGGEIRGFLVQPVPEPASMILCGLVPAGLIIRRRFKRSK